MYIYTITNKEVTQYFQKRKMTYLGSCSFVIEIFIYKKTTRAFSEGWHSYLWGWWHADSLITVISLSLTSFGFGYAIGYNAQIMVNHLSVMFSHVLMMHDEIYMSILIPRQKNNPEVSSSSGLACASQWLSTIVLLPNGIISYEKNKCNILLIRIFYRIFLMNMIYWLSCHPFSKGGVCQW